MTTPSPASEAIKLEKNEFVSAGLVILREFITHLESRDDDLFHGGRPDSLRSAIVQSEYLGAALAQAFGVEWVGLQLPSASQHPSAPSE